MSLTTCIYLDYASTTPVDPRVAESMHAYLTLDGHFGNPASNHSYGEAAKKAVEHAREQVADLLHAEPSEIIWTSGATESINLALKGAAQLYQSKGRHIVTVKTEHKAVLDSCEYLEKQGFQVTYLPVQSNGLLDIDQLLAVLRQDTILVSVMHVNNEIGVIQEIEEIAAITSEKNILLHVDAAQSAARLPLNLKTIPIDLLSLSAHKMYGPKGMGALYVRKKPRVRVAAQIHGGGQEQGMRSGTLPTHQIVGLGLASEIIKKERLIDEKHITALRDYFLTAIKSFPTAVIHSDPAICVPGIVNMRFEGIEADKIIKRLPHIAIAKGSACFAKGTEPSYVLRALGLSAEQAKCGLRFSFGRFTKKSDIDALISALQAIKIF